MTREDFLWNKDEVRSLPEEQWCDTAFDWFALGVKMADSHPHWILVEDELPPKKSEYDDLSINVLATDGKEIYESVYNHDSKDWFTHDMWGLDNISYWMYLPSIKHLKDKK